MQIKETNRPSYTSTVQYEWLCPQCGRPVVAFTEEQATPEEIAADARCSTCRKQKTA